MGSHAGRRPHQDNPRLRGAATASAARPLHAITRPEALEPTGEAIIDSHGPEDFLTRLRALPSG